MSAKTSFFRSSRFAGLNVSFYNGVRRPQRSVPNVNGDIQDAYAIRELYEQLGGPKYTDTGAIFDIMAFTVIQKGLELAESA